MRIRSASQVEGVAFPEKGETQPDAAAAVESPIIVGGAPRDFGLDRARLPFEGDILRRKSLVAVFKLLAIPNPCSSRGVPVEFAPLIDRNLPRPQSATDFAPAGKTR